MAETYVFGEAMLLGLASGPACIASCGPLLVPSLLAARPGVRGNSRYLSSFLGARFAGYLLFAAVAWGFGTLVSIQTAPRLLVFGVIHLLLAFVLLWHAHTTGQACSHSCMDSELVALNVETKEIGVSGPAALGFLTGLSLCPPFLAAGVRAAELGSMFAAFLFFAVFFVGTSVWFVPFLGLACVRRNNALVTVARMSMVLIAIYYAFLGLAMLSGRNVHVR